jgi:sterol desaturase/sphingolipid hydroxylase (fatty acid hydroxylase superfamily)
MALLYVLIIDFFYYWFHRWQHTTLLWEQHKFHHSEKSLNVTSTRRVHWLEDPLLLLFLGLPMGLLFEFKGLALGILTFIQILWLQFIHLNLRLEFGWLSPIITGPHYHRLHHSFQPEHLDKNFAAFFPLWDILFGTYYHPRRGEFPPTGLTDGETYNSLWIAMILPFREWLSSQYLGQYFQKMLNREKL